MKIALAQTDIKMLDKAHNLEEAKRFIAEAAESNARLVLFPEMSMTGFSMETDKSNDNDESTLDAMKDLAKHHGIAIGFGRVETDSNGKGLNYYDIVEKTGERILHYAKRHPFTYGGEGEKFVGGDEIPVISIDGFAMAVQICFDLRFPLSFYKMAEKTHLMIVPANWPKKRISQYRTLLAARAIENQYYVAGINCVGNQDGIEYNGQSVLFSPKGDAVAELGDEKGLLICDIEDDIELKRSKFPVIKDRRTDD
ncbi:MAG: carbon-nitrogen family hydrolase [Lachnospiraceae bacterium]|nr:carbon-nitrogen family hydrolase [Lachnospiraceae bacterium]MBR0435055.1 carbon-nitrogen family hydrolase [Lachnospiraceae bacterium]